jgi:hypothetical protein
MRNANESLYSKVLAFDVVQVAKFINKKQIALIASQKVNGQKHRPELTQYIEQS